VLVAVVSAKADIAGDDLSHPTCCQQRIGRVVRQASSLGIRGGDCWHRRCGFVLAGRIGWPVAFLAAAALMLAWCVHTWRNATAGSIVQSVRPAQAVVGARRKTFLRPHRRQPAACLIIFTGAALPLA